MQRCWYTSSCRRRPYRTLLFLALVLIISTFVLIYTFSRLSSKSTLRIGPFPTSSKMPVDEAQQRVQALLAASNSTFSSDRFPLHLLPKHRAEYLLREKRLSAEDLHNMMSSVRPVLLDKVYLHLQRFLDAKRSFGSKIERSLYANMSVEQLISRLFLKRAVLFVGGADSWMLPDGRQGRGGFELVGSDSERPPLVFESVLSYDEMALSALVALSSYSKFFNDGARYNSGEDAPAGSFEDYGVIVGQVGARFERRSMMDCRHMLVTREQNTQANGYGPHSDSGARQSSLLAIWAQLYGLPYFPLFEEAERDELRFRPVSADVFLDTTVFAERVRIIAQTLLLEANERARVASKKAYVHVVGLGLGVWRVHTVQVEIFLSAFVSVVEALSLEYLSDVDFSYVGPEADSRTLPNGIRIHRSRRNPQERLVDRECLLVVSYAWDSNAWPGNEFYSGNLTGSGDPAAAACSMIGELHNARLNPEFVNGWRSVRYRT